jgi:hypothetical protein
MRWIPIVALGFLILVAFAFFAHAEPRHKPGGWGGGWGSGWVGHQRVRPYGWNDRYRYRADPGTAFWGGVIGGALGGWLSSGSRDEPREEDHRSVSGEIAPFTPAWYDYCRRKYRSFNADTGRYLGFDGELHLCK